MSDIFDELPELSTMYSRMGYGTSPRSKIGAGISQQDRMIRDRKKGSDRALMYSYQSAVVRDIEWAEDEWVQALINSNKLKQDYDDKTIVIDYKYSFKPGTVFEWRGKIFKDAYNMGKYPLSEEQFEDNFELIITRWLVYLQDLTETSYFKGDIRRCRYTIKWVDEAQEEHITYAAIRGPVETKINFIQKSKDSLDLPNETLDMLIPYNEDNYKYFQRYRRFYLQEDTSKCWEVSSINSISTPGIIEVAAIEYYINKSYDDTEQGIPEGKVKPPEDPNKGESAIEGPTFITPKVKVRYTTTTPGKWAVIGNKPVVISQVDETTVDIEWKQLYQGQFTLQCGDSEKIVVVQPLFKEKKI